MFVLVNNSVLINTNAITRIYTNPLPDGKYRILLSDGNPNGINVTLSDYRKLLEAINNE